MLVKGLRAKDWCSIRWQNQAYSTLVQGDLSIETTPGPASSGCYTRRQEYSVNCSDTEITWLIYAGWSAYTVTTVGTAVGSMVQCYLSNPSILKTNQVNLYKPLSYSIPTVWLYCVGHLSITVNNVCPKWWPLYTGPTVECLRQITGSDHNYVHTGDLSHSYSSLYSTVADSSAHRVEWDSGRFPLAVT